METQNKGLQHGITVWKQREKVTCQLGGFDPDPKSIFIGINRINQSNRIESVLMAFLQCKSTLSQSPNHLILNTIQYQAQPQQQQDAEIKILRCEKR